MIVEMGLTTSKVTHDNSEDNFSSRDSDILPTILPLDKTVRVHLVPKFYTSEERGFTKSYYLSIKLQRVRDLYDATVGITARVEFHERRRSLLGNTSFIRRERLSRSHLVTVNSIDGADIEVKQVTLKENDSLRINGVFTKNLRSIPDLHVTSCDSFDLILCPSSRISSGCSEWLLLGTMYTKHANCKHMRHWRAAVRGDYT